MQNNSAAVTLYNLLVTRDFEPEILDRAGKPVTDPSQAELFSFDWKTANNNYGTVVALLGDNQDLQLYYGDNLGRAMESEDKKQWFDFLHQMKRFATSNLLSFSPQNINRLKYTMQGMAAIKEGLFEGYYGTRKVSYSDQPKKTRLMIRHSRDLGEGDARYRAIESLFVETADGERFRVPSRSLTHGRMLARHVAEGGTPYDAFGQHITEVVREMATLSRFVRAARGKEFNESAQEMIEAAVRHYSNLKAKAKRMISQRGYHEEREAFDPAEITETEQVVDEIRTMFVEQNIDQRIEEALPILAKLAVPAVLAAIPDEEDEMKEINEFESWAETVVEGTWALPDTPGKQKKLQQLMSQELIVGPDGVNATEQLYDLVGDDALFDIIDEIAYLDPDANAWDDPRVQKRLAELGITASDSGEVQEALQGAPTGGALQMPVSEKSRGRPTGTGHPYGQIDNRDDGLPRIGRIEKTSTGLRHHARPERGGSIPEPDPLNRLDRQTTQRLDRAFGVKYKSGGNQGVRVDESIAVFEPVKLARSPNEGDIHELGYINFDLLPGAKNLLVPADDYSDTLYYRDPVSNGIFSFYYAHGGPRIRGTSEMDEQRVAEIVRTLEGAVDEGLDSDGVMMTRQSNMSNESVQHSELNRLIELAKI